MAVQLLLIEEILLRETKQDKRKYIYSVYSVYTHTRTHTEYLLCARQSHGKKEAIKPFVCITSLNPPNMWKVLLFPFDQGRHLQNGLLLPRCLLCLTLTDGSELNDIRILCCGNDGVGDEIKTYLRRKDNSPRVIETLFFIFSLALYNKSNTVLLTPIPFYSPLAFQAKSIERS